MAFHGFSREQIQETLGNLLVQPSIHVQVAVFKKAFEMYHDHSQLSFTDCCLAAHAEVDDAKPLWTFDQKLANQIDGTVHLITTK